MSAVLWGGECIPDCLKSYVHGKLFLIERIRDFGNIFARVGFRFNRRLNTCDKLMFANVETKNYLLPVLPDNTEIITEVGINRNDIVERQCNDLKKDVTFLVAGRLIYRKGILFLLDVLKTLPLDSKYKVKIVGQGPEFQKIKEQCKKYRLEEHVDLMGSVTFAEMKEIYESADVLVMPSLRETTGTVLVEALCYGLPVITIDGFGGKVVLDESVAWFYSGNTKEEILLSLKTILLECMHNSELIMKKSRAAQRMAKQYTWEKKYIQYEEIYKKVLG